MKPIALAVALSLISTITVAETQHSAEFGDESKSGTEKSVSEDTNISAWGSQAIWMSRHPVLQRCLNLPRTLSTEPYIEARQGRLLKDESEINRYSLAVESSVCSMLIASAAKQASYAFVGRKKVPLPDSQEAAQAVAKIPVESLFDQAQQAVWFPEERLIELSKGEFAWRVRGTPYGYESKDGQFSISMSGKPWFDEQHIEGRVLTFKQARSSSTSSGMITKFKGEVGAAK